MKNFKFFPKILALFFVAAVSASLYSSFKSPLLKALREEKVIWTVFLGMDNARGSYHSDTIALLRYDPKLRSLDIFSIPRDTKIDFSEGSSVKKINEFYPYFLSAANGDSNVARQRFFKLLRQTIFVSSSTVVAAPDLVYFVQLNYAQFERGIDLLGGIPIEVDQPMHYDDSWGNLHVHFNPGRYWVNGKQALEFVRFRNFVGDYERIQRQQFFALEVLRRLKSPRNLLRLPYLAWGNIAESNFSYFERLCLLLEIKGVKLDQTRLLHLPGHFQRSYWVMDKESIARTLLMLQNQRSPKKDVLTVEVWNASSNNGIAQDVSRALRQGGFDVVKWGNYDQIQKRSFIRDCSGNPQQLKKAAQILKDPGAFVFTRIDVNAKTDIEVVIGENFPVSK